MIQRWITHTTVRSWRNHSRQVVTYAPGIDAEQIRKAFEYSWQMHEGQKRKSGEPYIEHPVQVLRILVGLKMDQDTLVASLLHDVVER